MTRRLPILALIAAPARADLSLIPGQKVQFNGPTDTFGSTIGAGDTPVGPFITESTSGDQPAFSISEEVFRGTNGLLDFYFQVHNTATEEIDAVFLSSYSGYATSVGYLTNDPPDFAATGTEGFNSASRGASSGGGGITFNFAGSSGLAAGAYSDVFFVATDSAAFDNGGTATVINGPTGDLNQVFTVYQPAGPAVPEPSSILPCGIAAAVGLALDRVRRMKVPAR